MARSSDNAELDAAEYAAEALRLVCLSLPYLAELVHSVSVSADRRVETAAVTPYGLILVHPQWFTSLSRPEASFVLAHELMHLALRHHSRMEGAEDRDLVNIALDCVVNDMLACDWGYRIVPAGGVRNYGARSKSFEQLITEARSIRDERGVRQWECTNQTFAPTAEPTSSPLAEALERAGLATKASNEPSCSDEVFYSHDLLTLEESRTLFPERQESIHAKVEQIDRVANEAVALGATIEQYDQFLTPRGDSSGNFESWARAVETRYRPPWKLAMQRWMDTVGPAQRTYARPSRRQYAYDDPSIVLPGRRRDGWTLNVVLDTSGSMTSTFGQILGVISSYCRAANIEDVRIVQCDTEVTVDERVIPEELTNYRIAGHGGSDMSPAMYHLAEDLEVEAVIVLTDGHIRYPEQPMPYEVLWVLPLGGRGSSSWFDPDYGRIVSLTGG